MGFPGIEPRKLKGKSFNSMALDIHILDNGKIQRTWHVEDWTLALDIMLETGRDVGSLDWPVIEKGETLKEVPQCIYNFYDKILSDSNGGGQNNKLLLEIMHRNAIVRPRMSSLGVVGIGGLKLITSYFADVMPDIKYERQQMWIHEDKVVVLHKVSATNIKNPNVVLMKSHRFQVSIQNNCLERSLKLWELVYTVSLMEKSNKLISSMSGNLLLLKCFLIEQCLILIFNTLEIIHQVLG